MRIAVYTIAKNEAQFIERWAESCKEADYRLIVDTGSIDDTVEVAKRCGCAVETINVDPWRFDVARNMALDLLPEDIDYCISLDADEVLMPGWRKEIEKVDSGVTRIRYKYVWSSNPDGSERLVFGGDKIHARHGYYWKHPVHEVITPTINEIQAWTDLDMRHYPDPTKSRGQYLPLLELSVQEDPDNDRNRYYLAREYMFHGMPQQAIPHFLEHLKLSTWRPERCFSMRYLAKATGDHEHWLLRACAESPERREPWVDLAQYYHDIQNWLACYSATMRALSIQEKPLEYLCEPEAWGALPHDLASVASWYIGLRANSMAHYEDALKLEPGNERICKNVNFSLKQMRKNNVHAVIPCKSNLDGLVSVLKQLEKEFSVQTVTVVADGDEAYLNIKNRLKEEKIYGIYVAQVELGSGIHVMWNKGMTGSEGNHVLFINDDVTFDEGAIDALAGLLDYADGVGIACPNYDRRAIAGLFQAVSIACPGNYDGTDGLAGFCMMLRSDMASEWKFDERMKWYYGDNDVINWVRSKEKIAVICAASTMQLNPSWTMRNDPPANFKEVTEQDRILFEKKWNDYKW